MQGSETKDFDLNLHSDGLLIREALPSDFPSMLELNRAWVRFLSPLDAGALAALHRQCAYRVVVEVNGGIAGFLLALCPGEEYDSPNYRWFSQQFDDFLYIDRVVVGGSHQGQGVGRALYIHVIDWAKDAGFGMLTCEIDIDPPNERSSAFHSGFGFAEIGRQWVAGETKQVSLQSLKL
ncbi:MAG: GNAT family N-acetyltransferase [Coriobacteriia bacterium]|nr:GNAT family N-acetyltransferase [Coriobacteriia bacterium]